ncbi:aminoglycoside phosphotransferase family protein, partial [Candidatus Gottesmanbacteria bacterium]|nr:aminoglycoside phosphotransferase family protein [Candidatus Gottesmanbacteria bacterium]
TYSFRKLKGGEINYSFKIETDTGFVLMRVFRYDSWPKEDTLRFVEEKLKKLGIRQSKIIYLDSSNKYFQNGFMVAEWIEGIPGEEAIRREIVSEQIVVEKVARILKKIHTIKFKQFGTPPFNKNNKGFKDFVSFVLHFDGENRLEKLAKEGLTPGDLINLGKNLLRRLVGKINFKVNPVMVHGDATPHNIIWREREPVLVDWEDVKATSWVYDLAWMSYWYGEKVQEPFFKGYGEIDIRMDWFKLLEKIFHLRLSLGLLPYYAYDIKRRESLESTIKKLKDIIQNM